MHVSRDKVYQRVAVDCNKWLLYTMRASGGIEHAVKLVNVCRLWIRPSLSITEIATENETQRIFMCVSQLISIMLVCMFAC